MMSDNFECDDCPMAEARWCMKAGYCHHRDQDKWREVYRSQDAGGSPLSASAVGWAWIEALALEAAATVEDAAALCIETTALDGAGRSIALFYQRKPIAVATIFRDQMNFAILVRWRAPE